MNQQTNADATPLQPVVIGRAWAMPDSQTFRIQPIADVLSEVVGDGWIDPFANRNSPAAITNDINEDMPTDYHMDAVDFLGMFGDASVPGVLFDPPYSMRQVTEKYAGRMVKQITRVIDEIARVVEPMGRVVSCGWNSNGIGKKRNFAIERVLIVAHGGQHNDTILTVERKLTHQGRLFSSR